jgi:hypothetical protein
MNGTASHHHEATDDPSVMNSPNSTPAIGNISRRLREGAKPVIAAGNEPKSNCKPVDGCPIAIQIDAGNVTTARKHASRQLQLMPLAFTRTVIAKIV